MAIPTPRSQEAADDRPGPRSLLVLSAWCGLVSGILEVWIIFVRKQFYDINKFY